MGTPNREPQMRAWCAHRFLTCVTCWRVARIVGAGTRNAPATPRDDDRIERADDPGERAETQVFAEQAGRHPVESSRCPEPTCCGVVAPLERFAEPSMQHVEWRARPEGSRSDVPGPPEPGGARAVHPTAQRDLDHRDAGHERGPDRGVECGNAINVRVRTRESAGPQCLTELGAPPVGANDVGERHGGPFEIGRSIDLGQAGSNNSAGNIMSGRTFRPAVPEHHGAEQSHRFEEARALEPWREP